MLEVGWIGALGLQESIRCLRPRGGEGVLEEQAFELAPGESAESEDFLCPSTTPREQMAQLGLGQYPVQRLRRYFLYMARAPTSLTHTILGLLLQTAAVLCSDQLEA